MLMLKDVNIECKMALFKILGPQVAEWKQVFQSRSVKKKNNLSDDGFLTVISV